MMKPTLLIKKTLVFTGVCMLAAGVVSILAKGVSLGPREVGPFKNSVATAGPIRNGQIVRTEMAFRNNQFSDKMVDGKK